MRGVFVINFLIEKKNNCLFIVTKIKKMRISELTEDRSEPDVMPEKSGGSAKIDHTVSTMPGESIFKFIPISGSKPPILSDLYLQPKLH